MTLTDIARSWASGGIQFISMSDELRKFRIKLESEAEKPIEQIEVNAGMLLSDLCEHLKLGVNQHDMILGQRAVDHITALMDSRVRLVKQ